MDIAEITQRLTRRHGADVQGWCAGAPALAAELAEHWALELGNPFSGGTSSVTLRCARSDGSPAVLKLSPDLPVVSEQAAMLTAFRASGRVPAVLAADLEAGALLLAAIEPGTRVDELASPPPAPAWAALLRSLHGVAMPVCVPRDLRGQCEGFFTRIGRRTGEPAIARVVAAGDVERGFSRCQALLASPARRVLLHGDLHLGNVLDGGPARGLVAIDPRACIGDPCFDAVDYLLDGAGLDGVEARCAALASAGTLAAGRLFAWCRAIAAIVAITYIGRPGQERAIPELLALAR